MTLTGARDQLAVTRLTDIHGDMKQQVAPSTSCRRVQTLYFITEVHALLETTLQTPQKGK